MTSPRATAHAGGLVYVGLCHTDLHASLLRQHLAARVLACMQDPQSPLYQAECVKAFAPKAAADPKTPKPQGSHGQRPGWQLGKYLPPGNFPQRKKPRNGDEDPADGERTEDPDDGRSAADGDGDDPRSSAPPSEGAEDDVVDDVV